MSSFQKNSIATILSCIWMNNLEGPASRTHPVLTALRLSFPMSKMGGLALGSSQLQHSVNLSHFGSLFPGDCIYWAVLVFHSELNVSSSEIFHPRMFNIKNCIFWNYIVYTEDFKRNCSDLNMQSLHSIDILCNYTQLISGNAEDNVYKGHSVNE